MTEPDPDFDPPDELLEAAWHVRERAWRRKLGRLRFGAEPLDAQVERYRRATWVLTGVASGIGLLFLGLISARFGRPDIAAAVVGILLVPVVALAWLDHALLRRRVAHYEAERREFERRKLGGRDPGKGRRL